MSLRNALGYLTILPLPRKKSVPLIQSIHFFPLVGVALGSLGVLFFLASKHFLPNILACFLTVMMIEILSGGTQLRGIAEFAQGHATFPGHGFDLGFRVEIRSFLTVMAFVLVKTFSLSMLSGEWQAHAVFVIPVVGHCAQTLAFVFGTCLLPDKFSNDAQIARRRVRAGLWSATLLLLLFLFPLRVAIPALALFAIVVWLGLKRCNALFKGLTLQTVALLSELSEASVLLLLAVAAKILMRGNS